MAKVDKVQFDCGCYFTQVTDKAGGWATGVQHLCATHANDPVVQLLHTMATDPGEARLEFIRSRKG